MTRVAAIFSLMISANFASPALAQTASPPALEAYVATSEYQSNITRLFASLPNDVFQRCATLVSRGSQVVVVTPASFGRDGRPISGLWKQSFPVSGCGNDTSINFFSAGRDDGRLASVVAAPGSTHADLPLQRDAFRFVMLAVGLKANGCANPHIRTTSYDGEIAAGQTHGNQALKPAWHETWSVSACGSVYRVGLRFVPDATGTQITTEALQSVE